MTTGTGPGGRDVADGRDDHDFLSGYLDGELTEAARVEVEARLAASAALRVELVEVRAARDAIRNLPHREAPAGFWDAVIAYVGSAEEPAGMAEPGDTGETDAVPMGSRRVRRVRAAWLGAAAAVAAAVIAVVVVPGRSTVRPDVTAVATQHGAASSNLGDSISSLAAVGPLVGRR